MNKVFVCGNFDFIRAVKDELDMRYGIECNVLDVTKNYPHTEVLQKQIKEASCMIVQCSTIRDIVYYLIGYALGCKTFTVGIDDGDIPDMPEVYDKFNLLFEDMSDITDIIEDIV